jgi:hypothetical protein
MVEGFGFGDGGASASSWLTQFTPTFSATDFGDEQSTQFRISI